MYDKEVLIDVILIITIYGKAKNAQETNLQILIKRAKTGLILEPNFSLKKYFFLSNLK